MYNFFIIIIIEGVSNCVMLFCSKDKKKKNV